MNELFAVLNPVSFLAVLVLVGYISEKTKFVPNIKDGISKIITHITLPVLVIVSLSEQNIRNIPFFDILLVVVSAFIAIFTLLIINYFVGKLLHLPEKRQLIHSYLGAFGNVIFLGYPFILYLFGETGLLYAIIFSIVNELIVWTFGAYFLNLQSQTNSQKWSIKYLLNPNTVSFFVGISMLLLDLHLPAVLHAPLEQLGSSTTPLSMMFIGSVLSGVHLKKAIKSISIWSLCLIKMIAMPIVFILLIKMFFPLLQGINLVIISVIALQIAMPSQANLSVLADRYNSDTEYSTQAIFITTVVSAITLPAVYFLSQYLFYK